MYISKEIKWSALGLFYLLLVGCSTKNQPEKSQSALPDNVCHINLSGEKIDELCKASSIADTVIYVPLETNSKSIFKFPSLIEINDSFIVVSDHKRIMAFRKDGKFISQIGKSGKGPGEFTLISHYILKGDRLFITSAHKREITEYTIQGKYLGSVQQKSLLHMEICEMPNGEYAWYDWVNGNVVFFDHEWKVTDTLAVENVSKNRLDALNGSTDDQFFVRTNEQLFFKDYRNDTIWDISSKKKEPAIIFNLKEKLLPDHLQFEKFGANIPFNKMKPYQRVNFVRTDSFHLVLQRSWSPNPYLRTLFVHNRITNEIKQYKKPVIYDDITGHRNLKIFYYFNNTIISFIDYSDICKSFEEATDPKVKEFWAQLLAKVNEYDNPTLVIIKLK